MHTAARTRDSQGLAPLALSVCSDKRLAALVAGGSRAAFAAIYERYHQQIYRYCASILRDRDEASDVLQSTMLRLLNGMIDRGPPAELRPWLYRIAHNEAISAIRRRRTNEDSLDTSLPAHQGVAREDARERLSELLADIGELPESQRGALLMHEVDGLPYSAVAVALGSSPAAVKQSVCEARRALHDYAAGRETECASIRRTLSDRDRRVLRGRKLAAHLRGCAPCREFKEAILARRSELSALAPPLPAASAAIVLQKVLAGSAGGGSAGGGGAAVSASSGAVLGSAVAKPSLIAALAVGLGIGVGGMPIKGERAEVGAGPSKSAKAPAASPRPAPRRAAASPRERRPFRATVSLGSRSPKPRADEPAGDRPVGPDESGQSGPRTDSAPSAPPPLAGPGAPASGLGEAPRPPAHPNLDLDLDLDPLKRTAEGAITHVKQLTQSTIDGADARLELSLGLRRPGP